MTEDAKGIHPPADVRNQVLSINCRWLLSACEQLDVDAAALRDRYAIDQRVLDDPDGRIAPETVFALWEEAERSTGDPHLALRVARIIPMGAYRVLDYLLQSAPTLGNGFHKVSEYFRWLDPSAHLPVVQTENLFGLALKVDVAAAQVPLRAIEFTFGTCLARAQAFGGPDVRPAKLEVAIPPPPDVECIASFFGCAVHFGSSGNRMLFDSPTWQRPMPGQDASLFTLLDVHARSLVRSPTGELPLSHTVRQALAQDPRKSIASVAKHLGLSVRTLQRRLGEEGTSFAELAELGRAELARSLVSEGKLALVDVAFLLGFSEQSAFTRSFKRWTGMPPAAYRTANLPDSRAAS